MSRAGVLLMLLFTPLTAFANGRFPATSSVALRPDDEARLLIGTTFGAVVSKDRGATWGWICEQAIGYGGSIDPIFVWTPNRRIFAVTFFGLSISRDEGCTWESLPFFAERGPSDIAVHPTQPSTIFVTTERNGMTNGLYRSDDDGETFQPTGLVREDLRFSTVRMARADPRRMYVAGARDSPYQLFLLRSDDAGATWSELPQQTPEFSLLYVLAVSPVNPDVLFVYLLGTPDIVLRSTDGAQSFHEVLLPPDPVRNMEVSSDGTTAWIATASRIYRSTNGGESFSLLPAPERNACVAQSGTAIYACGWPWTTGWAMARSTDRGDSWEQLFNLSDIDGVLECPAGTPTRTQCDPRWPQLAATLGAGKDGGTADGGLSPSPSKNCGCETAAEASTGMVLLVLFILFGRRSRRKEHA